MVLYVDLPFRAGLLSLPPSAPFLGNQTREFFWESSGFSPMEFRSPELACVLSPVQVPLLGRQCRIFFPSRSPLLSSTAVRHGRFFGSSEAPHTSFPGDIYRTPVKHLALRFSVIGSPCPVFTWDSVPGAILILPLLSNQFRL